MQANLLANSKTIKHKEKADKILLAHEITKQIN